MEENDSSPDPLHLPEHVIGLEGAPLTPSGLTKSAEIAKFSELSSSSNSKSNSNSEETTLDHTFDKKRLQNDSTPTNLKENHTTPDIRILGLPADENLRRACLLTCSVLESNFKFNEPTGVCKVHFAPLNLDINIVRKDGGFAGEPTAPPNTNPAQNQPPNSKQSTSVSHKTEENTERNGGKCCVSTCGKSYRKNADVRIFRFPKDENLRRAWMEACGIQGSDFKFTASIGVCNDHFLPQDVGVKNRRRGAIPSQNLPSPSAAKINFGSSAHIKGDSGLALSKEGTLPSTSRTQSLPSAKLPSELTNCCISTCGRNTSSHPNIRIFPFPSGTILRHTWEQACGVSAGLSRVSGVCHAHFLPHETSDGNLQSGCIPSIPTQNLPPNSKQSTLIWGEECCISTCGRGYRNTPNIRMFKFPLEENLRRAWMEACGIHESNLNICRSIRVCDAHFWPYEMGIRKVIRSPSGPIPSLNLPSSSANEPNSVSSVHMKGSGGLALSEEEDLPSTSHNQNTRQSVLRTRATRAIGQGLSPQPQQQERGCYNNNNQNLPCNDALHPESCNYCLHSQKRGDIFRLRYKSLVRKIAKLKNTLAGKRRKMKHLKSQSNLKLNLDLRRPKDRTRMREILRKIKGLSNSAQVMFLMLIKPFQRWEEDERQLALSLCQKDPSVFYFMSEKLNLHVPSRSSMRRWVHLHRNASNPNNLEVKNEGGCRKDREWNIEEIDVDLEDPEVDNTWNIAEVDADVYHEEVNGVDIVYEGAEGDDIVYEGAECDDIVYEGAECDDIEIKSEIIEIDDVGVYEGFVHKCDTE